MTKEQIYLAADKSYATCLVCSVNPTKICSCCDTSICDKHSIALVGHYCPLCYAIELVHQRHRITNVVQQVLAIRVMELK